ncbi:hypothetical protein LRB91_18135 [Leclercia adecarboxylata]|uniref:LexA family protein n=1 Tax=Leclercia adecarboxylata TaxID=83655 RepID=UPI0022B77621|nr:hypothetical protein [Leclercia adecarboxylata]
MKTLTIRQQEVLDLLLKYQSDHGYPPTISELSRLMGVVSPNAAALQLRALQRKEAITIVPGAHRGIKINSQPPQPVPEGK